MKISSTRYPVFSRYYLSTIARSKTQKKKLLKLLLRHVINNVFRGKPYDEVQEARKHTRAELKYMIDLLKSIETPEFINKDRLIHETREHLKNNRDPSNFLIPLLEFCIWHNLFINDIQPTELISGK